MNVLVLGGTGWVGHHTAMAFADVGYEVTIGSRGRKRDYVDELGARFRMVTADKSNAADMRQVLAERYDVIVDSVPTAASIDAVVRFAQGLKHYLHCSSTGGYAPLPFVPGDETMPYDHFCGGWKQKAEIDSKVLGLHASQGFPATVLRPSYITGPGLLPLDNLGGRRGDFIADILAGRTLDMPDNGLALLHPVHVRDLATAFVLAAARPEVSIGQIYNICLDHAVTLNQYIRITAAALDRQPNIHYVPLETLVEKYRGQIDERGLRFLATHMCFDITKARTQLGYRPRGTTEQAITETARWSV